MTEFDYRVQFEFKINKLNSHVYKKLN
jgi:hypothetical protein